MFGKVHQAVSVANATVNGSNLVDTDKVLMTAAGIKQSNEHIDKEFSDMSRKVSRIEQVWDSPAGSKAATVMYRLFSGSEARHAVLQNYVVALDQLVAPNYQATEEANSTLADQFK